MSCPSSIRRRDSNPRPLERESTPITTRVGTSCRYRITSLIRDLPMDTDFHLGTIHMSCMRLRRKGVVPKIRKFASMCQCNCLSQPHASNASRVNEPLGMDTDMRWKWYLKTPCAHQRDGI